MDTGLETPLNTPTKCGCASGIVVSCGGGSIIRKISAEEAKRKVIPASSTIFCPLCADSPPANGHSNVPRTKGTCSGIEACCCRSGTRPNSTGLMGSDSESSVGPERRSYTSMFRGALGRWSGRKRSRAAKYKEARSKTPPPHHVYQVFSACTNNNCVLDRCKLDNRLPAARSSNIHTSTKDSGIRYENKRTTSFYSQLKHSATCKQNPIGVEGDRNCPSTLPDGRECSFPKQEGNKIAIPAGATRTVNQNILRVEDVVSTQPPRQKLPSLPYRDESSEVVDVMKKRFESGKRRRGKRKYFSSPIHRKEQNRVNDEVQSTYVSFQDEFAHDVRMKIESGDMSAPSTTPESIATIHCSRNDRANPSFPSQAYLDWLENSDSSPFEVSPTTPTDDVFDEWDRGGCNPPAISAETDRSYLTPKEEEENARIAKLFYEVKKAFGGLTPPRQETSVKGNLPNKNSRNINPAYRNAMEVRSGVSKCRIPSCGNVVRNEIHSEPIESIMANAKLQACLDNAMCMLNESTKLLISNRQQFPTHASYASRHQSCTVLGGASLGQGAHQAIRPRTYSTCSRLETIAEENDRGDGTPVDITSHNAQDSISCTFSDSSEYEIMLPQSSSYKTASSSLLSSATTFNRDSDSTTPSLQRRYADALNHSVQRSGRYTGDLDPKTSWLLRGSSCSTPTIAVRTLRRENDIRAQEIFGPTSADRCAACEWARYSQFNFPSVPVIPNAAWTKIVSGHHACHDQSHMHPWGLCAEQHPPPMLCHTHHLQYYQYLQNNPKTHGRRRQAFHSASSQADSLIDYDINEVVSSLDELMTSEHSILSSTNSSVSNLHRSTFPHSVNDPVLVNGDHVIMPANVMQRTDKRKKHPNNRKSDTDVSINSDSAFSTNGSLTPSTRDGVNTDRDSVDSTAENTVFERQHGHQQFRSHRSELHKSKSKSMRMSDQKTWYSQGFKNTKVDSLRSAECECPVTFQVGHITECHRNLIERRGSRTQSYEEPKSNRALPNHDKRYSVISSVGSSSSPLTSANLCDSAVHLQDTSSSSHSTHLSSDSFYSSRTSFGDKETCFLDRALSLEGMSRSSSETSLKSESTLCLSDFAVSQQNIALLSYPSFPHISEICSPVRLKDARQDQDEAVSNPGPKESTQSQFEDWMNKAEITESVLESFMNSNLAYLKENSTELDISLTPASISDERESKTPLKQGPGYDSLTSSSASSDSNTLGSGSSGSTYATSSLRTYRSNSHFNTFDSSSCVSTDDTGETVIDQFMIRPNRGLHNIEEENRKKSFGSRMRYQPSTFHYENLEIPSLYDRSEYEYQPEMRETEVLVKEDASNTKVTTSRTRSPSLPCIMTSVTTFCRFVRQTASLPDIHVSQYEQSITCLEQIELSTEELTVSVKGEPQIPVENETTYPSQQHEDEPHNIYNPSLQIKVDSMIQNCNNIDNVITSLRESLQSPEASQNMLDRKLVELADILRQKDEMITRLHKMLLACSATKGFTGFNYQTSATI